MQYYELYHFGTPMHSGRYPYGSGKEPYQHYQDFISRIETLRNDKTFTWTDEHGKIWTGDNAIAKSMGLNTTEFRIQYSMANDERKLHTLQQIKSLKADGLNNSEIGRRIGKNESVVRSMLNEEKECRMNKAKNTAEFIKKRIDECNIIDVGKGVERELNVSRAKFDEAVYMLQMEGYPLYGRTVSQVTNPGKQTILKVLCKPGTEKKDIYNQEIGSFTDYVSHDSGETFVKKFVYPESCDSKRISIKYAEDGGINKDGLIEIRRGCKDLDLGNSHYAQVRILVDGTHYLKGMAIYSDDIPPGKDIVFNTNKKKGTPMCGEKDHTVLKKIKNDPENPFGALIKENGGQMYYTDSDGKKKLGLINKKSEEGDWSEWADKIPSQFLAKQNYDLIKRQLKITQDDKFAEFKEICDLDNPTVKKKLLQSFADDCDAAAVHLKVASLPRQKFKVILPIPELKDTEVYAPTYETGEKLALIRYPHGGIFEIPILTVNNKHVIAKKVLGNAIDAIGINSKVAEILSGADFDGDTVTSIPTAGNGKNMSVKISNMHPLEGLKDFDPKMEYPYRSGMKVMKNTNQEMGKISNLITDMTAKGATEDELARAVRHSMVVIDAEKHKLDYKKSEIENNIASLRKRYQQRVDDDGKVHKGASTLMSRSKSPVSVIKRKGAPIINPETGEVTYKQSYESYVDKKGKTKYRMQDSTLMAETKDAHELSSGTKEEEAYADYANSMKSLANQARKEMVSTPRLKYNKAANLKYKEEDNSLKAKLNLAEKNRPKERRAQIIANEAVKRKKAAYFDDDIPYAQVKKELKKVSQQELARARLLVGCKRETIKITEREWEAIQAGAISDNRLQQIMDNADMDVLRQLATPRATTKVSPAKIARIKAYKESGYTIAEIAKALGVSTSLVSKELHPKESD